MNTKSFTFPKNFLKIIYFIFGCAGSLLLCGLFSGCGEQGLLSSHGAQASRYSGLFCCGSPALGHSRFSRSGGSGGKEYVCSARDLGLILEWEDSMTTHSSILTRRIPKDKTAYEISRCDWSSDVCSSDLHNVPRY